MPACKNGLDCGSGDRATDSAKTFDYLGVDDAGRIYGGGLLFDHRVKLVGLDGHIDRLIRLPMTVQTLAVGHRGELYFTTRDGFASDPDVVVWRWDPQTRRVARFAGRAHERRSDDVDCGYELEPTCELDEHLPATRALFSDVTGLAVDGRGRLLIADPGSFALRRVELDGTLSTIAGTGRFCLSGNACSGPGGSATATRVGPSSVAAGRDGSTWFTSLGHLYRVAPNGGFRRVWTTVTKHAMSVAVDRSGNAVLGYWPTGAHARLDRISPNGRRTSILDDGANPNPASPRTFGDGAFASSAGVVRQVGVVATSRDGDIYFTDASGEVRYIPVSGRPPARLALAAWAPAIVRRNRPLLVSFRVDAAATITLEVIAHGRPEHLTSAQRTAGTLVWRQRANGTRLAPGSYHLRVIATDSRGRSVSRILPVRIADT